MSIVIFRVLSCSFKLRIKEKIYGAYSRLMSFLIVGISKNSKLPFFTGPKDSGLFRRTLSERREGIRLIKKAVFRDALIIINRIKQTQPIYFKGTYPISCTSFCPAADNTKSIKDFKFASLLAK